MSDTLDKAKQIILHAAELRKNREKSDRESGREFNIFSILNLSTSENRTHSAFLRELLDPNGSHGQGDVFLKLFLAEVWPTTLAKFNTANADAQAEYHIDFKQKEETEGGRIDILITDDRGHAICIENKIHTGDQNNQLIRYYAFLRKLEAGNDVGLKKGLLLYLTLDGKQPTPYSTEFIPSEVSELSKIKLETGKHFECISYNGPIRKWLEACREKVTTIPTIREGITHYINLIDSITMNNLSQEEFDFLLMNRDEIKLLIARFDSFEGYNAQTAVMALEELKLQLNNDKGDVQWEIWEDWALYKKMYLSQNDKRYPIGLEISVDVLNEHPKKIWKLYILTWPPYGVWQIIEAEILKAFSAQNGELYTREHGQKHVFIVEAKYVDDGTEGSMQPFIDRVLEAVNILKNLKVV
jgi:hypothetical protein